MIKNMTCGNMKMLVLNVSALILSIFFFSTLPASAQIASKSEIVAETLTPTGPVHFQAVLDLAQEPGAQPQLRRAEIARTADWPTVLYARFQTTQGTGICTAALVGPQAVLTAAHCVPASGIISFTFAKADFVSDCTQHPGYSSGADASADYALCRVRSTSTNPNGVALASGYRFERISTSPLDKWVTPSGGDTKLVSLTGYGCFSDDVGDQKIDDKFRVGLAYFTESSNSTSKSLDSDYYTPREKNNLITAKVGSIANLCPGDSGGPVFATDNENRVIIGVNSRVFYTDSTRTRFGRSLISATGGPSFEDWAVTWAEVTAKAQVCGISGVNTKCK